MLSFGHDQLLEQAARQIEQLTEAQIAELRGRRDDPGRRLISHTDARECIARLEISTNRQSHVE